MPVTLLGLSMLTSPTAAVARWLGWVLIESGRNAGQPWTLPLDFYDWPRDALLLLRDHNAPAVFAAIRLGLLGLAGIVPLWAVMYHISNAARGRHRVQLRDMVAVFALGGPAPGANQNESKPPKQI